MVGETYIYKATVGVAICNSMEAYNGALAVGVVAATCSSKP